MREGEGDEEDTLRFDLDALKSHWPQMAININNGVATDRKEICPDTQNETEREKDNESKERT